MAVCNMTFLTHMGTPEEPASLSRYVKMLSRTNIKEKNPDLNASHALLEQVGTAHILALMTQQLAGVTDNGGLASVVADGSYVGLVDRLVDEFLPLGKVNQIREDATEAGRARYKPPENPPRRIQTPASTQGEARTQMERQLREELKAQEAAEKKREEAELYKDRDFVNEDALLFIRDFLIYWDGYSGLRSGDSGRFEKHLEMVGAMFQGTPRLKNYRNAMMDFNATRSIEWTKEMRELWMLNCFVNLGGEANKFLAIDEFNEWIVRGVKRTYNQLGSLRSTNFTCDVISPNLMPLRDSYQAVLKSSGAHDWGYRHSKVDAKIDIRTIADDMMVKERIFVRTPGRIKTDASSAARQLVPRKDTFMEGMKVLVAGDSIVKFTTRKYDDLGGTMQDDFDEEADEMEGADIDFENNLEDEEMFDTNLDEDMDDVW